jgi:hypothetical protein
MIDSKEKKINKNENKEEKMNEISFRKRIK